MVKLAGAPRPGALSSRAPDLLGRFVASQGSGDGALQGAGSGPVPPEGPAMAAGGGPPGGLQPIGIPLVCSGCDAGVLRYYAPIFESFGLEPTAGGGVAASPVPLPFAPGTAI